MTHIEAYRALLAGERVTHRASRPGEYFWWDNAELYVRDEANRRRGVTLPNIPMGWTVVPKETVTVYAVAYVDGSMGSVWYSSKQECDEWVHVVGVHKAAHTVTIEVPKSWVEKGARNV